MRHDVSYAVRQIRLHPVPAALVVLAFALGIGLNTALFTLVNSILLRSMPGSDNGRVVAIWERTPRAEFSSVSGEAIREWRSQAKSFEAIEAYTLEPVNLTGVDPPEVLSVLEVSASYFQLLRAQPALGRAFRQGEDQPGAPRLAVLSHDFWQRRFGAGRTVLGRTITLDRSPHVIVGVMPAGFRPAGPETAVYLPLVMEEKRAWSFWVIARLNPGVSLAMAQSEMNVVASRMRAAGPAGRRDVSIGVLPIQELWVKDFRAALWLLMGATGLVLLIACANIANLLLARGASRAREFAIRLAVGASRGRLVRQLTIEGLLLALVGGAFGLLLAQWTITAIVRLGVEGLPLFEDPRLDVSVFAFAASVSLLTGIAASAGPAFAATRREHTASRFGRQVRPARLLVVSEFAIAFVLAVSATLLVRSFTRLEGIDLGFDPQRLLTMQLSLPPSPQNDGRPMAALYNRILERIQRTAGVEAAAAATRLPVGGVGITLETRVANRAAEESKDHIATQASIVSTGYFATLRIPIRRGRLFNPHDRRGSTEAVIINETFASRHFPNEDPIGRALLIETLAPNVDDSGKPAARQIVGIVADVRGEPLRAASQPAIYLPLDQSPIRFISLAVRARGDPLAIAETVRRAIAAEDKELPASDVRSMESRLAGLLAGPRNATALAGALAVLAVVLASLGVYGTLSFNTARRTQEIGVRFALGARQGQVLGLVLSECALVAVFGIVPGAALSFAAARLIESQLFDVSPTDPLTFIAVCAGLMTTALVSGLAPAMRAARVDPMTALRHD